MNFLKYFALTLSLCFCLGITAFAEEPVGDAADETSVASDVVVEETTDAGIVDDGTSVDDASSDASAVVSLADETSPGYSTYSLDETTPSYDSGSMAAVILHVFGEYQPRTQTVTNHLSDGTSVSYEQIVPGVAGMDWHWIAGVALFSLILYSFLKLVGVLLKND